MLLARITHTYTHVGEGGTFISQRKTRASASRRIITRTAGFSWALLSCTHRYTHTHTTHKHVAHAFFLSPPPAASPPPTAAAAAVAAAMAS